MINLHIPYSKLELVDYEGAGNKTPVLDLSCIKGIANFNPINVREYLENNLKFRKWLKAEGQKHQADTIMLYYTSSHNEYQYVTFIGEPNTTLAAKFSEMCGNGIRALALHIYLNNEEKNRKFAILAGSVKQINLVKFDRERKSAQVMVDMGKFNERNFNSDQLLEKIKSLSKLKTNNNIIFTLGSNGLSQEGEPHLVVLYTWNEFAKLSRRLNISLNTRDITHILRNIASAFGKEITFETSLFPHGMNFNIGVIRDNHIYMTTHERSLSVSKESCQLEIQKNTFCKCNTLACGTGGAAVANVARLQGLIPAIECIKTIHPGGEIKYKITQNTTFMIGPVRKVEF